MIDRTPIGNRITSSYKPSPLPTIAGCYYIETDKMHKLWMLIVLVPLSIAAIVVNFLIPTDQYSTLQLAENAYLAGNFRTAEGFYAQLVKDDPSNISLHRDHIRSHFNIPEYRGKHKTRDDKDINDYYANLARSHDTNVADIGHYGFGFIHVMQDDYDPALHFYQQVTNQQLPYLNNSIGYVHMRNEQYSLAEQYFIGEITSGSNVSGAYSNLAKVYLNERKTNRLAQLLGDPNSAQHLSNSIYRKHYLAINDYSSYLEHAFKFGQFTTAGMIGAALILLAWSVFLRFVDVFEPESVHHILIALALGGAFSFLAKPLYDSYAVFLHFELNGSYLNDFLYSIFAIGLIEECVKVLPVLILMRFKHIFNESVDYIIYPSICALGFAFTENLMYFHEAGLDNIVGRAFSASILHMALTTFAVYGIFYAKYKARSHPLPYFVFSFLAACVVHGVYDFWLIAEGWVASFRMLSVLVLLFAIQRYAWAISNSLNHSEFNHSGGGLVRPAEYLAIALTLIAIYQYIVIALSYGPTNANMSLFDMLLNSSVLGIILVMVLGNFRVTPSSWKGLLKFNM